MKALETKQVDAQKVIGRRHTGSHDDLGNLYHKLAAWAREHQIDLAGRGITIFHSAPNESEPQSAVYEVCLPVTGEVAGDDRVCVKELPACTVAYATVEGPYSEIPAHYSEALAWISVQGMEQSGAPREVHIKHPDGTGGVADQGFVTEIQFPVSG